MPTACAWLRGQITNEPLRFTALCGATTIVGTRLGTPVRKRTCIFPPSFNPMFRIPRLFACDNWLARVVGFEWTKRRRPGFQYRGLARPYNISALNVWPRYFVFHSDFAFVRARMLFAIFSICFVDIECPVLDTGQRNLINFGFWGIYNWPPKIAKSLVVDVDIHGSLFAETKSSGQVTCSS